MNNIKLSSTSSHIIVVIRTLLDFRAVGVHSLSSHTLNMRHPLSDADDASTIGSLMPSLKGRHASLLIAAMWQRFESKANASDGGSAELPSEHGVNGTDHNWIRPFSKPIARMLLLSPNDMEGEKARLVTAFGLPLDTPSALPKRLGTNFA